MTHPSRGRLRAALISLSLVAGLAFGAAPPGAVAASSGVVAAPGSAATAGGLAFYILPTPNSVACTGLATDSSADPSIDRNSCAFIDFDGTGIDDVTKLTADLFAEGASTPFAQADTGEGNTAGTYQVQLQPDASWTTAGRVRVVIKYDGTQIAEMPFNYNALSATLSPGAPTTPGTPFDVSGTLVEHVGGPATVARDDGVPATFKIQVRKPDGTVVHTSAPQTAASNGTFTYQVPGAATAGLVPGADTDYRMTLRVEVVDASYSDTATPVPPQVPTGGWKASTAGSAGQVLAGTPTELRLENKFVSSVGWVKPGDTYPSRVIVTNPTTGPLTPSIAVTSPDGATILKAGAATVNGQSYTWSPGTIPAGESRTLVLESKAATSAALPTIVWRDLSTTAVLTGAGPAQTVSSHGPKVIPPSTAYDTARYGDRPFPIVPLQFNDRSYQANHSGESLREVISDPGYAGSTFNLYQESSLKQLYPDGTVPSAGIASADFTGFQPAMGFSSISDGTPTTCRGFTYADLGGTANPLYSERITNGVYNLPGSTDYYGDDANGSALIGAETGVGALQNIDAGCGPTAKVVKDAVALADPEIDYSDYDTDKDGVVDFFMGVFAGCGGNGSSQLGPAGCDYPGAPYDNIWPHSSTLEGTYKDPVTGLPGVVTNDQLKDLEGRPLCWTDDTFTAKTPDCSGGRKKVYVRVGPYNLNPETSIEAASVISHEYGHSLGLPDYYSTGSRSTYGTWSVMAEDHSQDLDAIARQELGWVVPRVLPKSGTKNVTGWKESKQDTDTITWQQPDGTPYTLTEGQGGVGRVQNSEMYVAKLPGRQLLDPSVFTPSSTNEGASASHLWWSGSGNDFGCAPTGGRNFDLAVPGLASLPAGSTVKLTFKSRWDIEWDFDYGYVLTTTDGGQTYKSHPSEKGYTTSNTDPTAGNPNQAGCQTTYDNGITGTSGSYQAQSQAVDRKAGNYPAPVFLSDSYDISDLAGKPNGALRFSYATDPGLARPGWFIDDVKVTATTPSGDQVLLDTDFEGSGGPDDPRVFNGGCRESLSTAQKCTQGWKYLKGGALSTQDHAYYLEMRDRSGFDFDGRGQADRGPATFGAGLYLSYTDESHGYGNVGTDDPPAASPLDSVPEPGNDTPNLDDAAFVDDLPTRASYTDSGAGHTDNYTDPTSSTGNWEFKFGCLTFRVSSMTGEDAAPAGNLTGDVNFEMGGASGTGCGDFDYGYDTAAPGSPNTAPTAKASATPPTAGVGQKVRLSAAGSTDAETPDNLTYSWDFDNGGTTKDAVGRTVEVSYANTGVKRPKVTVSDPQGLTGTASTAVTVTRSGAGPVAVIKIKPKHPGTDRKTRFVGKKSTGVGKLRYRWNFHNGGKKVDARGKKVKTFFRNAGRHKVTLTVIDSTGASDKASKVFRVRHHYSNRSSAGGPTAEKLFRELF